VAKFARSVVPVLVGSLVGQGPTFSMLHGCPLFDEQADFACSTLMVNDPRSARGRCSRT
jgi:hypothetical protein